MEEKSALNLTMLHNISLDNCKMIFNFFLKIAFFSNIKAWTKVYTSVHLLSTEGAQHC